MDLISELTRETAVVHEGLPPQPTFAPSLSRLRTVTVVWLGVLFGVHALFAALLLLGYKTPKLADQAIFTEWGRELYHPERDIPLYILSCGATFVACAVMLFLWNRAHGAVPSERKFRFALDNLAANLTLAASATILNPLWFFTVQGSARSLQPHWVVGECVLLVPIVAEAAAFLLLLQQDYLQRARPLLRVNRLFESLLRRREFLNSGEERSPCPAPRAAWNRWDAAFLLLIFLFVYSPRPDVMAGFVFQSEHFHHWDYFVMGPALGFLHGQALNTQVYSQYGIGFPLLFALLNPVYSLSYGHIFQFTNIYTCFYVCGVYLFLRCLLRNPLWAAFGAFTFAFYKMFNWTTVWFPPFQLPSNTVLRGPFDIWFLLALLLHQQTRRKRWLLAAGALTGLSLLFETDTGVYITFTFAVYTLFQARLPFGAYDAAASDSSAQRRTQMLGAWGLFGIVFLSGMAIAGRGTMAQPAFWRGWIECFTAYPNGISMMPVAEHLEGMFYGMIMVGVYLFALCYHFHRMREASHSGEPPVRELSDTDGNDVPRGRNGTSANGHERRDAAAPASPFRPDLLLVCVALYGTCSLLHFMGRSHPTNLHVSFMAFILLCVVGLHTLSHHALNLWPERLPAVRLRQIVWGALGLYGLFTWWHEPHVRAYPNYVRRMFKPIQPREITLYVDEKGVKRDPHQGMWPLFVKNSESDPLELYPGSGVSLPHSFLPKLQQYTPVVEEARRLSAQGNKIAILANDETWLYLASGATPWYRYSPFYPNIITKTQLARAKSALLDAHVDYVFIESSPPITTFVAWHPLALFTTDVWRDLRQFTAQNFTFERTAGMYEIWKR